ncbi:lysine N(6)-hydroxylase/L-ornithine N(5)-oxygenase family protein [Austwickia chelonae]|uniref:lysine N(6)-hydroxylase/L-ornithine N(5)-oxygenase family protein n=1 Tax=Austwickia chelonae TaxID=100225 RepID=UPI000E241D64|nr:SidA/IucD/PvdA family monooxygenase [Austwickia chelonae]
MYDIIGIGFGPANIALAIALADHNREAPADRRITAIFLEKRDHFTWHPGMMLPGTTMQISFLKDLVTYRDPAHPLSFLTYVHQAGRLPDFVNKQSFFPTRQEFADYLTWAAKHVEDVARYGSTVTGVEVDRAGNQVTVTTADGATFHGRSLVHAPGLVPIMPVWADASDRVFHTHDLLTSLDAAPGKIRTAVVIGSGQSAAEAAQHLHDTCPERTIHAVFGKVGYTPADDSPFANRIFDPDMVDRWHGADPQVRERMYRYHRGTNYSAVDPVLIEDLYTRAYEELVTGRPRLHIHNCTEAVDCTEDADGVTLTVRDLMNGREETLRADAVVMATGYRGADPADLFGNSARWYRHDNGLPAVLRDYRWAPVEDALPSVYLNGGVEHTHGLTSALLSNLALRSSEILDSILAARAGQERASA